MTLPDQNNPRSLRAIFANYRLIRWLILLTALVILATISGLPREVVVVGTILLVGIGAIWLSHKVRREPVSTPRPDTR
ncbi:hypothetical protein [Parvularcula sp. LCG005]|uniref:hypothetical protein n=1 Tax=Parvularcula sp. LCG005 TaxID=3078805 RepID=UPI0029426C5B|nr:hypothetical protein [Parvularcula sp. LCG005]WOI52381.1 hypothetical protein RUI03_09475 [Parvularcula sp. LCG005]